MKYIFNHKGKKALVTNDIIITHSNFQHAMSIESVKTAELVGKTLIITENTEKKYKIYIDDINEANSCINFIMSFKNGDSHTEEIVDKPIITNADHVEQPLYYKDNQTDVYQQPYKEKSNNKIINNANRFNKYLLVSFILGAIYAIYIIMYFGGAIEGSEGSEQVGAALATALVLPHMICTVLAVIFNGLGLFMNKRGFALTGAILYAVALVMFIPYFMFIILQMILSFIGFAKMKNKQTS